MGLCIFTNVTVFCVHLVVRNKQGARACLDLSRRGRREETNKPMFGLRLWAYRPSVSV